MEPKGGTSGAVEPASCALCGQSSPPVAAHLGVCGPCIRRRPRQALPYLRKAHARVRRFFHQPVEAPRAVGGRRCGLCVQDCVLGEGQVGYCGLRMVQGGRLVHLAGTPQRGLLDWYRDPLPTNCVAMPVCAGRGRRGQHNLAVFYRSCALNCLFCQNWHFREGLPRLEERRQVQRHKGRIPFSLQARSLSAQALAQVANIRTFCVCFFGGDPAVQMPHALATGRLLAERGVVVCWETAGTAHPRLMGRAVDLSLRTGGTVKFDLKAYDETLHLALTGASNRYTLENFVRAARRFRERPDPPLVVASTLLVPGYVDAEEVYRIARFIAQHDRRIPYVLLAFAPHFFMPDLPTTSVRHAEEALQAARDAGLRHVRIGNRHLLGWGYG